MPQHTLSDEPAPLPVWLFWWSVGIITAIRLVVILLSPLELGVDEAQYWLWGQNLDFGYYSKPPLIGWLLGMSDFLFGASAAATRITAPFLHLGTSLILYHIAIRTGGRLAGQLACLLWLSLPAVALGSFVISTDSIMLFFWSAGLAFILRSQKSTQFHPKDMLWAGLAVGVALLAKYAAIYFVIGLAGWLLSQQLNADRRAYRRSDGAGFILFITGVVIGSSPTWIWNMFNGLVTLRHLGENANLEIPLYSLASALSFLGAQAGVIGPVCFMLLAAILFQRPAQPERRYLKSLYLWFVLPPLGVMIFQAYLKEANANWAVAGYPAAMLLLGLAGAQTLKWYRMVIAAISVNLVLSALLAAILAGGSFGMFAPKSDPLRRLKGWSALAADVAQTAQAEQLNTIIAHNRATAALLHWHLADSAYQIVVQPNPITPSNHYERAYPFTPDTARPALILSDFGKIPDFPASQIQRLGTSQIQISSTKMRNVQFWRLD